MKNCPHCNATLEDNAVFCPNCGTNLNGQPFGAGNVPPQATFVDPYDHTAEFDPKDISDNKVFAMLGYLLGTIGVIIALLASHSSKYTMFHVRHVLKFTVVNILMWICAVVLCWTFIAPIAAGIMSVVFLVIKIICFFQVCSGKAKDPAIIRSLGFLK